MITSHSFKTRFAGIRAAIVVITAICIAASPSSAAADLSVALDGKDVAALEPTPPDLKSMATSKRRFMNTMFFFDDWNLRIREGFDRKQGQPKMGKELLLDFQDDPDLKDIRGLPPSYDPIRDCYTMIIDCHDKKKNRFWFRIDSKHADKWPPVRWRKGDGPLWTRVDNVFLDQDKNPLCCFNLHQLGGTPWADKGYFVNLVDRGNATGFSKDGLNFQLDAKSPWVLGYGSDTSNWGIYNPWSSEFMIFCRPDCLDRRISRITSTDLKTFSKPQVVLQPDALDPVCREFYGVGPFVYGDMFLATLSVYDSEPTEQGRYKWQGTNQMQLAYSYNGENWYRASREMFIPRTEPGTYAGGSVYGGLVGRTAENRLLFCAMVTWTEHGMDIKHTPKEWRDRAYRVYLYDMRLDGFVYLRTRAKMGVIRTKVVVPQGGEMTINTRTTPSGYTTVAFLDELTGKPIPKYTHADCKRITGDHLFGKLQWGDKKNLDELKGKRVLIEVRVREGELYALRFTHQVAPGQHIRNRHE